MERLGQLDGFSCHLMSIFINSVKKIKVSLTSDKNNVRFTWTAMYICDHFLHPFRKSCHSSDNVEKYRRAGQAIDDNMAYAH
jgi:hypothetical protein